jgi:hypothetical protein
MPAAHGDATYTGGRRPTQDRFFQHELKRLSDVGAVHDLAGQGIADA